MVGRREERSALLGLGLLLAGVGLGIAAALLFFLNRGENQPRRTESVRVMAARGSLTPRIHLFGDRLVARVDVTADRLALDPSLVRVHATFEPYQQVGETVVTREDAGRMTRLSFAMPLACVEIACVPRQGRKRFEFPPASVEYRPRGTTRFSGTLVEWPVAEAATRLGPRDLQDKRFRANVFSLPEVSYRLAPGGLAAFLYGAAFLLACAAGGLLFLALRGRLERPAPTLVRTVELPPLERALRLVETANGRVGDQRRALELLAKELAARDEPGLSGAARELAWSPEQPSEAATRALTSRVRSEMERVDGELS